MGCANQQTLQTPRPAHPNPRELTCPVHPTGKALEARLADQGGKPFKTVSTSVSFMPCPSFDRHKARELCQVSEATGQSQLYNLGI